MTGEKEIYIDDLKTGMIITKDVIDKNGLLIIAKGSLITEVQKIRLINYFHSQSNLDPIFIESSL